MRKSLRYGLMAAACLLVALAVVPTVLIDKNAVKHRLARAVYEATGRELAIDGGVGFSVIPTPRFRAEAVRLANWSNSAEPWMLDIRQVTVTVSPLDLLWGRVVARAVELDTPHLILERRAGRGNWVFTPPGYLPPRPGAADVIAAPAEAGGAQAAEESTPAIAVEKLLIRNGRVDYIDASGGKSLSVDAMALEVKAQSLQGPFQAEGTARIAGRTVTVKGDIGRTQADHAVPLHVETGLEGGHLRLDGLLLRDTDSGSVLKGNMDLKVADAGDFATRFGLFSSVPLSGHALAASGQVRIAAEGGELNEAQIRLGPVEASGTVAWVLDGQRPKLSVNINTRHLDLDSLTAPRVASEHTEGDGDAWFAPSVAHAAVPVPDFALPVDADLLLKAETVTWRGQATHAAVCDLSISRGDIVVNQVSAELPGVAQVRAFGFVGVGGAALRALDLTV
ncbi:MAG: AsmA family protein, partial [Rhodospirillaceae bacterium]|nr:AsmA family protein [Rhodospirillaceae bacterium]